jgi:hypothetical protein
LIVVGASKRYRHCALTGKSEFALSRWFTGYVKTDGLGAGSPLRSTLSAVELFEMVRDYVKQETLDPLRGVGRWLAWGIVGAIALLFGAVVGLVGLLRFLQAELFTQQDRLTWAPYFIVMVVALGLIWLSLTRIARPSLHREG